MGGRGKASARLRKNGMRNLTLRLTVGKFCAAHRDKGMRLATLRPTVGTFSPFPPFHRSFTPEVIPGILIAS